MNPINTTIQRKIRKTAYKQGAEIVLFEFRTMTGKIREELNKLKMFGINVKYFTSKNKVVIDL